MSDGVVVQRKRVGKGRSRNGCQNCRARRIKCDEGFPSCRNCMKGGRECINSDATARAAAAASMVLASPHLTPKRGNSQERALFHYYEQRIAPTSGGLLHQFFWTKTILPAAQVNDSTWSAVLALSALHQLPEIASRGLETVQFQKQALTWYNQSITTTAGLVALGTDKPKLEVLLSSMLFFFIENQQRNQQNAEKLLRIAFSIVFEIEVVDDITTAMCLPVLLDNLVASTIDSTCVPQKHSEHAYNQALRWTCNSAYPKLYCLRIQLFALMHECHTFRLRGLDKEDYETLLSRLQNWWQYMHSYSIEDEAHLPQIQPRLRAIKAAFRHTWIQFQAELHVFDPQGHDKQQKEFLLEELESFIQELVEGKADNIQTAIDSAVLPNMIFLIWHASDVELLERLLLAFETLRHHCLPVVFKATVTLIEGFIRIVKNDELERAEDNFFDVPRTWQFFKAVPKLATKPLPTSIDRDSIYLWLQDDELV